MPLKNQHKEDQLSKLFKDYVGKCPEKIDQLPNSGSNRKYFRLQNHNFSAIGVYNPDKKENIAFIQFTNHFIKHRINVPQVYAQNLNQNIYLINDLGDTQLLTWLNTIRTGKEFPKQAKTVYKKVLQELVRIQIVADKDFDYSWCYSYSAFDKESILYDLNYFKKYFVNALNIKYKNNQLFKDFDLFSNYLLQGTDQYFMYRDFQARNIMLVNGDPYFIDYQGGRKGALQYDLASLLFQAKANITHEDRDELLNYYLKVARLFIPINRDEFIEKFYAFALIRVLQTLGAYGLRGIIEKKQHFIESIPNALKNLFFLGERNEILRHLETLNDIIQQIINKEIKS
ncbi:MAG: aminoglycoside phosphotransferase family protein [Thiohalospira sp.]